MAVLFGNELSALKSVPAAIFSILRSQKPLNNFESNNPFVLTLHMALSLGGDTDTIAGALYGTHFIPNVLQRHCEDINVVIELADNLYKLVENKDSLQ